MDTDIQGQLLHAIQCGTVYYCGQQFAQGFRNEMGNWLNTGHSREFWLCEFAGRAMQAFIHSAHWNKHIESNAGRGYGDETTLCCNMAVEQSRTLVKQLESHLKGTTDAQPNPQD